MKGIKHDFNPDHYVFLRRLPPGPPFKDSGRPGINWATVSVLIFVAVFWYGVYCVFS
jgi:hypothetical protein